MENSKCIKITRNENKMAVNGEIAVKGKNKMKTNDTFAVSVSHSTAKSFWFFFLDQVHYILYRSVVWFSGTIAFSKTSRGNKFSFFIREHLRKWILCYPFFIHVIQSFQKTHSIMLINVNINKNKTHNNLIPQFIIRYINNNLMVRSSVVFWST